MPQDKLAEDFIANLERSRKKHPGLRQMFDGLLGEIHELKRAYKGDGDVKSEALDVAVCAYRIATEGDEGGNVKIDSIPDYMAWGQPPPSGRKAPQAWFLRRNAKGRRDDGLKIGPFWTADEAYQFADDRHTVHELFEYPDAIPSMDRVAQAKTSIQELLQVLSTKNTVKQEDLGGLVQKLEEIQTELQEALSEANNPIVRDHMHLLDPGFNYPELTGEPAKLMRDAVLISKDMGHAYVTVEHLLAAKYADNQTVYEDLVDFFVKGIPQRESEPHIEPTKGFLLVLYSMFAGASLIDAIKKTSPDGHGVFYINKHKLDKKNSGPGMV